MSNYTRTRTITRQEHERLLNDSQRLQTAQQETQRIRNEAASRERQIEQTYQANLNSLNQRLDSVSRESSREVRELNEQFRRRLSEQAREAARERARQDEQFRQELSGQAREAEQERARQNERFGREISNLETRVGRDITRVNGRIDEANEHIGVVNARVSAVDGRVSEVNARVAQISNEFSSRFDDLARRESEQGGRAQIIADEFDALMRSIDALSPERFEQGSAGPLRDRLGLVRGNISRGEFQSAISSGQDGILEASRLLARLIYMNDLFNERLRVARERANALNERIDGFGDAAVNVFEFELAGERYSESYQIDFWSSGEFSRIQSGFRMIVGALNDAESSDMTIEDIEIHIFEMQNIDNRISACDQMSRESILSAYSIANTSVMVQNALSQQGWIARGSSEDLDPLKPQSLMYDDGSGTELTLILSQGEDAINPTFTIEVFDGDEEDSERSQEVLRGVCASLSAEGIALGETGQWQACRAAASSIEERRAQIIQEVEAMNRARSADLVSRMRAGGNMSGGSVDGR